MFPNGPTREREGFTEPKRPYSSGTGAASDFVSGKGTPITRKRVTQLVVDAGKRAGLRATPHRIRHSFATHLLRHGASVRAVQKLLGHSSLLATQVYLDVDVTDLASMLTKSHPRGVVLK